MLTKEEIGQKGEQLAAEFLAKKGYKILHRNYRHRRGEIDIIASHDDTVIFVEVKTRTDGGKPYYPEKSVGSKKINSMLAVAAHYRESNPEGFSRYDVISVVLKEDHFRIFHFEDALWV